MPTNPNDHAAIDQLQRGQFEYPDIPLLFAQLDRQKTTLKAAYSTILNSGLDGYLDDLILIWNRDGDIHWQNQMLINIYDSIQTMIQNYHLDPNEELLKKIFIRIQLWGGNTGRGFFVRDGGFYENYSDELYRLAIETMNDNPVASLNSLLAMNRLGVSFATKHFYFWGNDLPVLDKIISVTLFGRKPDYRPVLLYQTYLNALDEIIRNNSGLTRLIIERAIFNWVDTADGTRWYNLRLAKA